MKVDVKRNRKLFEIQGDTLVVNSQSPLEDIVLATMNDCGLMDCFSMYIQEHYENDVVQRLIRLCEEKKATLQDIGIVALFYYNTFEELHGDKISAAEKVFCEITSNEQEYRKYERCLVYFLNFLTLSILQSLSGFGFCELLYDMHKELVEQ